MVGIVDIILNEDLTSELGLLTNQEVTASNGVKYQWKGAAWVVTGTTGQTAIGRAFWAALHREQKSALAKAKIKEDGDIFGFGLR